MHFIQNAKYVSTIILSLRFASTNLRKSGSYYKYIAVIVEITLNITRSVYVHVYTHLHAVVQSDHLEKKNVSNLLKQETFYW